MPYILPTSAPPNDNALDDAVQATIVGVTGIVPNLVRPRWQPKAPVQPDYGVNWIAFGLSSLGRDTNSYQRAVPGVAGTANGGGVEVQFDERLLLLLSFYGPAAGGVAARFAAGLELDFNRFALDATGIKLTSVGDALVVPALMKDVWVRKVDVRAYLTRRTVHLYAIANIEASESSLDNEQYRTPISVGTAYNP